MRGLELEREFGMVPTVGVFTSRALPLLREASGRMTNAEFHQRVLSAFGAGATEQTPQLDCSPSGRTRALLAPIGAAAAPVPPASLEAILARLDDLDRRFGQLGV